MSLLKPSPCKVNLMLNILGRRPDGYHELESVMHPVGLFDEITFDRAPADGVRLTCNEAALPTDSRNLVHRAAVRLLEVAGIREGVRIHLEKRIPVAAGLGGGSGNAATTLLGMNELFGSPLTFAQLDTIAAGLGSDISFFLQHRPALASGRGERIQPLEPFPALDGAAFLLIYPGFGISTAWAYQQLTRFPAALNGEPGRCQKLVTLLGRADLAAVGRALYNSLEPPALEKYPVLSLYQEFLKQNGAAAALMSGSGSTTFAVVESAQAAEVLREKAIAHFGRTAWTAVVPVG